MMDTNLPRTLQRAGVQVGLALKRVPWYPKYQLLRVGVHHEIKLYKDSYYSVFLFNYITHLKLSETNMSFFSSEQVH
jgi:hypothetical protein